MSTRRMQRNLTIMFTDISGFTRHTENISRDQLMNRLETHNKLLMPIVAHFEGKVIKTIGDSFLITFESPTNAVQCGTYMQYTLRKFNQGLSESDSIHIKVSINSGEVTVTDNDVFGDAVNVAAKIEKATNPDEIYFTENVFLAMNKAEVPNTFVKMFRPKGENSPEIKLFKVVQDVNEEAYKRLIEQTKIDADKMKTRVIELSNTAEKEFTRYQDAIETLVDRQQAGSKATVIAVIGATLILGAVILTAVYLLRNTGPTPQQIAMEDARALMNNGKFDEARELIRKVSAEHGDSAELKDLLALADLREGAAKEEAARKSAQTREAEAIRDARDYLKQGRTREARALLRKYADQYGENSAIIEVLVDVEDREVEDLGDEIERAIANGKPENADKVLKDAVVPERHRKRAAEWRERIDAYLAARKLIAEGDFDEALRRIEETFGLTNPGDDFKALREQARTLRKVRDLLKGDDAPRNGAAVIKLISDTFGDAHVPPAAMSYLVQALRYDLLEFARREGGPKALARLQDYRARFGLRGELDRDEPDIRVQGLWSYAQDDKGRREFSNRNSSAWEEIFALRAVAKERPDVSFRLGLVLYDLCDKLSLIKECYIAGFYDVDLAVKADPKLMQPKPDLKERLIGWLGYKPDRTHDIREFVKKYYYNELREDLIKGLDATYDWGKKEPWVLMRMNCLAVLTDMGEADQVKDIFGFFKVSFQGFFEQEWESESSSYHLLFPAQYYRALFTRSTMTFEDYSELRRFIQGHLTDIQEKRGSLRFTNNAATVLKQMMEELQAAQPEHTANFKD